MGWITIVMVKLMKEIPAAGFRVELMKENVNQASLGAQALQCHPLANPLFPFLTLPRLFVSASAGQQRRFVIALTTIAMDL